MSFSENLKNMRLKNNLSQEKLAKKLGVTRQSISKWELGKSLPDIDNLCLLSKVLNTTADFLLDNVLDKKKKKKKIDIFDILNILTVSVTLIISIYYIYKTILLFIIL